MVAKTKETSAKEIYTLAWEISFAKRNKGMVQKWSEKIR